VRIEAAGVPPKLISEFVGRVATATESVSIAVMESPTGWSEPGQTPDFDEYSLVLSGELLVRTKSETIAVAAGGARYVSVCVPAFSPDTVHRDP
jgi:quercetin dioxygenase-like cupin family protein